MPKPTDKNQRAKFEEAARKLGCDDDEAAFDEKLGRISKAKPQKREHPQKG